jgi:tRNA(fMet)-specific endonuclease VapC
MGELAVRPVLDTDVLIDFLRGAGPGRELVRVLLSGLAYRVTVISAFELALGRSYGADPAPVDALLAVPCHPLSRRSAVRAGVLVRDLRTRRSEIGMRDAMQAAISLESGLPLVTRNTQHFERIGELEVVHPDEWRERVTGGRQS